MALPYLPTGQSEADSESSKYIESGEIEGSSDSEEENFLKVWRNKKRMRILSSSSSEDERTSIPSTSQNVIGKIKIDGTQWIKLKAGGSRGRTPVRIVAASTCRRRSNFSTVKLGKFTTHMKTGGQMSKA